jgi:hypothetical protein
MLYVCLNRSESRSVCLHACIEKQGKMLRKVALLVGIVVTTIISRNIPNVLVTAADWVTECNESGFDPEQLACQTCQILPAEFLDKCQKCCQSWLDIKRITKPYAAAVVVDRGSQGDVETFFKENWDEVVEQKGTHQLQKIETPKEQQQIYFYMPRPSQVLFFDDGTTIINKNNKLSFELPKLVKMAKEIVNLDGMKREDIKDMLLTLLP